MDPFGLVTTNPPSPPPAPPWVWADPVFRVFVIGSLMPASDPVAPPPDVNAGGSGGPGSAGPSATNTPGRQPCAPNGTAPSPEYYAAAGAAVNALEHEPPGATFPPGETNLTGAIENADNLLSFHRGGALDAQVRYGGSPAYASYVFGVYTAAAGFSLGLALAAANAYAALWSRYPPGTAMSKVYTRTPAGNVANTSAGYNAEKEGSLCQPG